MDTGSSSSTRSNRSTRSKKYLKSDLDESITEIKDMDRGSNPSTRRTRSNKEAIDKEMKIDPIKDLQLSSVHSSSKKVEIVKWVAKGQLISKDGVLMMSFPKIGRILFSKMQSWGKIFNKRALIICKVTADISNYSHLILLSLN